MNRDKAESFWRSPKEINERGQGKRREESESLALNALDRPDGARPEGVICRVWERGCCCWYGIRHE